MWIREKQGAKEFHSDGRITLLDLDQRLSVPRRDLSGAFPASLQPPRRERAALPELIDSAVQGRGYWVEFVEGAAVEAGVQPGDVILTIAGKAARRHQDVADCVEDRWANERVAVRVPRAGMPLDLTMRLRAEGATPFNVRSGDFATMFEHDAPVVARECGGPVVDLTGKAIGVTIARGPYGCVGNGRKSRRTASRSRRQCPTTFWHSWNDGERRWMVYKLGPQGGSWSGLKRSMPPNLGRPIWRALTVSGVQERHRKWVDHRTGLRWHYVEIALPIRLPAGVVVGVLLTSFQVPRIAY